MPEFRNVPMPLEEANLAVEQYNLSGKTARAVRMFLSGICPTRNQAALEAGVSATLVTRALNRMTLSAECSCCGHPIKTILTTRPVREDTE